MMTKMLTNGFLKEDIIKKVNKNKKTWYNLLRGTYE